MTASRIHKGLVLMSAVVLATTHIGLSLAFAVLFEDIRVKFGESRATTAAVGSIFSGFQLCSGFFVGMAIHRFGPRIGTLLGGVLHGLGFIISYFATSIVFLQIVYGVLCGIGDEFVYLSTSLVIPHYFKARSAVFALTAVTVGPGIGAMCLPFLLTYLTRTYTLNGTFLIMGGILMNSVPCALLWSPLQQTPMHEVESNNQSTGVTQRNVDTGFIVILRRLGRNRTFTLYTIGTFIVFSTLVMYQTLMTDIWLSKGLTSKNTTFLLSVFYLIGIIGRLGVGVMKLIPKASVLVAAVLFALMSTVSAFALIFATNFAENVAVTVTFGIGHGGSFGAVFIVVSRLVEGNELSLGLGVLIGLTGVLSAFLPPIHGYLRDITGSYFVSIMYMGCSMLVGTILLFSAVVLRIRREHPVNTNVVEPLFLTTRL